MNAANTSALAEAQIKQFSILLKDTQLETEVNN